MPPTQSNISPQDIKCYDIDKTIFLNSSQNNGHMHSQLSTIVKREKIPGIPDNKLDLNTSTIVYDTQSAPISKDRQGLLTYAQTNMQFNPDIMNQIAEDIKKDQKIAMTSFTHFPDVAYAVITDHLKKKPHNITQGQIESSFKLVGGFPPKGPGDSIRKTNHILEAQKAYGVKEISLDGVSLVDDDSKNILRAWSDGMKTSWVNENKVQHNMLPVEYKINDATKTAMLDINQDGSVTIPKDFPPQALQAFHEQTRIQNISQGMIISQPHPAKQAPTPPAVNRATKPTITPTPPIRHRPPTLTPEQYINQLIGGQALNITPTNTQYSVGKGANKADLQKILANLPKDIQPKSLGESKADHSPRILINEAALSTFMEKYPDPSKIPRDITPPSHSATQPTPPPRPTAAKPTLAGELKSDHNPFTPDAFANNPFADAFKAKPIQKPEVQASTTQPTDTPKTVAHGKPHSPQSKEAPAQEPHPVKKLKGIKETFQAIMRSVNPRNIEQQLQARHDLANTFGKKKPSSKENTR